MTMFVTVSMPAAATSAPTSLASPKSAILTRPFRSRRMFSGLMSRWTTPSPWAYSRASQTWGTIWRACRGVVAALAMPFAQRAPEAGVPQVEHFFMVIRTPPCIDAPCRRGYRNRKTTVDGSTSGKGGEEFLELIVDLVLPFDGPGYLLLE